MLKLEYTDFQDCLSVQPRRKSQPTSKIAYELASELLALVNDDSAKAMAIVKQIVYYNPNKSVEWYYEQAISQLNRRPYSISG
ncbi:MAG: hypothetical protein ACRC2S_15770 [Waterburya sp.]